MIYSKLNQKAKSWWYHEQLRSQGKHQEARKRERQSIRLSVSTLRNAQMCVFGRGGYTIHCTNWRTLQGYETSADEPMIASCIHLGISTFNTSACDVYELIKVPLADRDNFQERIEFYKKLSGVKSYNVSIPN